MRHAAIVFAIFFIHVLPASIFVAPQWPPVSRLAHLTWRNRQPFLTCAGPYACLAPGCNFFSPRRLKDRQFVG
jgi:hypothetical protein